MKHLLISLAVLAASQAGAADMNYKPGTWEWSTRIVKSDDTRMTKAMNDRYEQLRNMPPEARAKLEEALAKMGGAKPMSVNSAIGSAGANGAVVHTTCESTAEKKHNADDCENKTELVANGYNLTSVCKKSDTVNKVQVRFKDATHVTISGVSKAKEAGRELSTETETTGRWLGASCSAGPRK